MKSADDEKGNNHGDGKQYHFDRVAAGSVDPGKPLDVSRIGGINEPEPGRVEERTRDESDGDCNGGKVAHTTIDAGFWVRLCIWKGVTRIDRNERLAWCAGLTHG